MADKMTDESALADLDDFIERDSDADYDDRQRARKARAHIAARLGGGEAVGEIRYMEGTPVDVNFYENCNYGCGLPQGTKLYTTPPARLAATAVGVTEEMVEAAARALASRESHLEPDTIVVNMHNKPEPYWVCWAEPARAALEAAFANQTKD